MCSLNSYEKLHENFSDKVITWGGKTLTEDSTTYFLKSLSVSINFVDTWLKALAYKFAWRCRTYVDSTKNLQSPQYKAYTNS